MGGLFQLIIMLFSGAEAACEDPAILATEAENAVVEARLEEVNSIVQRMEAAFACGGIADRELLARMWLAEGAAFFLLGDERSAEPSFSAAARVSPDVWNPNYGSRAKVAYDAAAAADFGQGTIAIDPAPVKYLVFMDGEAVQAPIQTTEGLHLIQVGPSETQMRFARIAYLPTEQRVTVATRLVEEATPPDGNGNGNLLPNAPTRPDLSFKKNKFLYIGIGAGVLGGGTALLALQQRRAMTEAESLEDLDRAYGTQRALGITSYALMGVAATGVTLHFTLK